VVGGFTGPLLTPYTADGPRSACWDSVGPTHCPGKTLTVEVDVSHTHKHALLLTSLSQKRKLHTLRVIVPVVCCVDLDLVSVTDVCVGSYTGRV